MKRKLKIALVSQEYPPETARGGIGSQTFTKARGLAELGHQVFVISRSLDLTRCEETSGKVTVIRIPGMEDQIRDMTETVQWLTHSVVVAAEIEALHSRVQLDIIDFPEWAAEGYTFFLNRTGWNYIPAVVQLHGPLVMFSSVMNWPTEGSSFYNVGTRMEATCIQLADAVYSSSQCSADWVRKYYDPKMTKIPTIHLGVDTKIFAPQSVKKNDHPTIIFVGKLVRNKGIVELIGAAIDLLEDFPDLRLRIVGGGEETFIKQLKRQAEDARALSLLDFAGYKQKEELPMELSKAHLFVLPSYYEGGPGFVFLEAMACGLPVIGCNGSGVEEIVTEENGTLVPPKDSNALSNAIKRILGDMNLLKCLGENARQHVLNSADSADNIKKVEKFYLDVVEEHIKEQVENSSMVMT
jgi:glycosyltransferase involved in cell wall biosynthesis